MIVQTRTLHCVLVKYLPTVLIANYEGRKYLLDWIFETSSKPTTEDETNQDCCITNKDGKIFFLNFDKNKKPENHNKYSFRIAALLRKCYRERRPESFCNRIVQRKSSSTSYQILSLQSAKMGGRFVLCTRL